MRYTSHQSYDGVNDSDTEREEEIEETHVVIDRFDRFVPLFRLDAEVTFLVVLVVHAPLPLPRLAGLRQVPIRRQDSHEVQRFDLVLVVRIDRTVRPDVTDRKVLFGRDGSEASDRLSRHRAHFDESGPQDRMTRVGRRIEVHVRKRHVASTERTTRRGDGEVVPQVERFVAENEVESVRGRKAISSESFTILFARDSLRLASLPAGREA